MVKSVVTVELSIGDPELAGRVRAMLAERRGFDIVAADRGRKPDVLITDTVKFHVAAIPASSAHRGAPMPWPRPCARGL